jgi:uncharacterized membrane-anchored protein
MSNLKSTVVNARPSPELEKNTQIYCYSFLRQDNIDLAKEKQHTLDLMCHKNLSQKFTSSRLEIFTNEEVEIRKEIHHEFVCYIFIIGENYCKQERYFKDFPEGWLEHFPGRLLTKISVIFQSTHNDIEVDKLSSLFGENQLIGNGVENNSARIWTDFYANANKDLLKILIEDISLGPKRRGRLCQNIVELENYRSIAEIGFPIAEEIIFELEAQEVSLALIVNEISQAADTEVQQKLLNQLLDISVKSENWRSKTGHRFSATAAYQKIFEDRLRNLDETKVLGYQSFSKFFNRNTMPTFRTCEAANDRLNVFITRIDRAIALLSTRIRSSMEQQNTGLLTSMDEQNRQQITLQETIETFAIVAISYNASALIHLLLESINAQGVSVNVPLYTSISIPITIIISFVAMKYLKRRNILKRK